ncbi:MAG TPA: hypothetical protein VK837_10415 [Longimicrobiales bacterium]|nr:hypothetical protein [Longimicrobiales bacterium]
MSPAVRRSLVALAMGALAGCAAACGGVPAGNPLPDLEAFDSAAGRSYRVLCHFPCAGAAAEAAHVADLAGARAAALFGLGPPGESVPAAGHDALPAIRLYRTEAFREVARSLTRDHLEEGAAFSSPQRRTAFIELIPPVDSAALRNRGLPAPTLRLVAHEAAHLALAEAAGGAPGLPDWLSEGAALAVEREVARRRRLFAGTRDPRFAAQTWRTYALLRTGRGASLGAVLTEGPNVASDRYGYALRALAFAFLRRERPDLWSRLVEAAGERLGDEGVADSLAAVASTAIEASAGGAGALDEAFAAFVEASAATVGWLELRSLAGPGDALPHAGLPRGRVTVLSSDPWRGEAIAVSGTIAIDPSSRGAMALALAGLGRRQLVIAFDRAAARVVARTETSLGGRASSVDTLASAAIELASRFDFEARLAPGAEGGRALLEVSVAGAEVLRVAVDRADARGDWGVIAEPGAAGVWSALAATEPER